MLFASFINVHPYGSTVRGTSVGLLDLEELSALEGLAVILLRNITSELQMRKSNHEALRGKTQRKLKIFLGEAVGINESREEWHRKR